jgi:hypothetical protein
MMDLIGWWVNMENYINFIAAYFQNVFYTQIRLPIFLALDRYFGIIGSDATKEALTDLDGSFITGTGINKFEIIPLENGEMRVIYRQEFTIKQEYLGLIPVLANSLGYVEPVEPEVLPEPTSEPEPVIEPQE